ncbi:MerR family transcriptional regulator [Curvivirga aplysinae]|uniref:MerR family transcriptional regulator n=1 Tax=Curvivirga aplysinae TaxID=2529852 RepID=UPI0012BC44B7|nr:MerR family DNA-binding transcriptional regulator [Curvivirga aplysinae]MTI09198.1 MerR family DNA-binding transcriptional regulator [Curvivirga aplysinae]
MSHDNSTKEYSISDLAEEFDVTTRTIRFYEDKGMIHPERRGQTRVFLARDRVRLKLILRGKRLGFTLKEICEIIDMYDDVAGEKGQLNLLLEKIKIRRTELEEKRRDLDAAEQELIEVEGRISARMKELGLS